MRKWHPFHKLRGRLLGIQNDLQLGLTTDEALDQRLGQLWKDLQANKPIHDLAQMEGWVMLDAYLSKQLASMVKELPEKILQGIPIIRTSKNELLRGRMSNFFLLGV